MLVRYNKTLARTVRSFGKGYQKNLYNKLFGF